MTDQDKGTVTEETGSVSSGAFGKGTTYEPAKVLAEFAEKLKAQERAAPEPMEPVEDIEPDEPAPVAEAAEKSKAKPAGDTAKKLAAKLVGKETPAKEAATPEPSEWGDAERRALARTGLKDSEIGELQALAKEKSWVAPWLEKLQRVQAKQDADFAALKAGTREPTPGARNQPAQEQGDQPGSGKVADLFEQVTAKLADDLGDENATLLRQAFGALQQQNDQLREELHGYARSVTVERQAAEIESMVQKSRSSLREEFPWIDDDARFEAVALEMSALRPDQITPDGVRESMRKAARIVFFDDVKADAASVASKLDSKRKTRTSATAPNGSPAHDDSAPLDDYHVFQKQLQMREAGVPQDQIIRFVKANQEKRLRAQRQK